MSRADEIIQSLESIELSEPTSVLSKSFRWARSMDPSLNNMRMLYNQFGDSTYSVLKESRKNFLINVRNYRKEMFRLGYTVKSLKTMSDIDQEYVYKNKIPYVDPNKVEADISKPKVPSSDIQHKIITDKIQNAKQSNYQSQNQQVQRKAKKRKTRAAKNVDQSKIHINSETKKGQVKKAERQNKILSAKEKWRQEESAKQFVAWKNGITQKTNATLEAPSSNERLQYYKQREKLKNIDTDTKDDDTWKDYRKAPKNLKEDAKKFFKDIGSKIKKTKFVPTAKKILKNKFVRKGLWGVGSIIATNFARSALSNMFSSPKAIPEEYEKGYDIISEHLTDFGSPLKLAKSAHKVMIPYYSTVRSGLRTNVRTIINGNFAIASSKNAIRHTLY